MNKQSLQSCLSYIDSYWNKIILKPKHFRKGRQIVEQVLFIPKEIIDNKQVISVPYTCIVPNLEKFSHIFYWDTYFMFRGILGTRYEWVIPSMVENFIYLFKKYQIIPNLTHAESLGRSQPPFLSSMILDAYGVILRSKKLTAHIQKLIVTPREWLMERMTYAQQEYITVWQNAAGYNHFVPEYKLNRYGNTDVGYAQDSEQESGWDMTSRFYNRCNQFLPIDLNCFLYKYERDFSHVAQLLNQKRHTSRWDETAKFRADRINNLMWNDSLGFYMDYDYVHKKQSEFMSLAGFIPLWAGIASFEQAKRMKTHLKRFETAYGLTITDKASLLPREITFENLPKPYQTTVTEAFQHKQWDYPHIWPPLEYLTVVGLLR
ncbi:MAG: hypothetical protein KGL95_08095, partial [Patescibacteria group bacterium]|nr:hypothetical protein [Patescibacteria group bacterium]